MSNYSPEIIKQAENLITEHMPFAESGLSEKSERRNAVKAAIASCEFALPHANNSYEEIKRIKKYLEELL